MLEPWKITRRLAQLAVLIGAAALASGCGGSDDDATTTPPATTVQITGIAAVGAAIPGATVTGVNARGETFTATTDNDGRYTLDIPEGAPYLLSVTDADGNTWASYAPAAGRANLTPLTTLALSQAWGQRPLADLLAGWPANALSADAVLAAAATVNANFAALMTGAGVDPAATNVFTLDFSANGQGLDAVLDAIRVGFSCTAGACTHSITSPQGQVVVSWNGNIATAGYTISWSDGSGGGGQIDVSLGACTTTPTPGTYSLVVETSVSGLGGVPIPAICIDGLPGKPANQGEFCGSGDVNGALPPGVSVIACSYDGSVGSITARITTPVTLDYTVNYTYVLR